eukprot:gene18536-20396_t
MHSGQNDHSTLCERECEKKAECQMRSQMLSPRAAAASESGNVILHIRFILHIRPDISGPSQNNENYQCLLSGGQISGGAGVLISNMATFCLYFQIWGLNLGATTKQNKHNLSIQGSQLHRLYNWAPYIGKFTRKSRFLINTEYKKVNNENRQLEIDCRQVTEERLMEMLHDKKASQIEAFAKSLGVSCKGTKLEILLRIRNGIATDCEKFDKAFKKMCGKSGGWVSAACEHGIVYGIKFV